MRRRAAMVATAVALPLTVLLVLLVNQTGLRGDPEPDPGPSASGSPSPGAMEPIEVTGPAPTAAADTYCPALLGELPVTLDGQPPRTVHSESPHVAAWGDPPVVFRCGVERPESLRQTSALQVINGVQWYPDPRDEVVIWTTVDRPVHVEVTVPIDYASAPVAGLIEAIRTLPEQALSFD